MVESYIAVTGELIEIRGEPNMTLSMIAAGSRLRLRIASESGTAVRPDSRLKGC